MFLKSQVEKKQRKYEFPDDLEIYYERLIEVGTNILKAPS